MLRDLFSLFPAYAGVILSSIIQQQKEYSFPRICGGDPIKQDAAKTPFDFSPHMRG